MDLADYERRKFELAEILRAAAVQAPKRGSGLVDVAQELFARLAEDRFNLAVVGRFSRGKSSLMNAIMGLDRLPTGIVPLTSVITSVSYGSEERVALFFEGRSLVSSVGLSELARYVTQAGNPGNEMRLRVAEVRLPSEILRRGFYFIDTPGLGSQTIENTRTTEAFLPAADAFLLVTSYDGPLSEDEVRFLRAIQPSGRRVFVAVNKHDAVPPADRASVLAYVTEQLRALFGDAPPRVFSTSAVDGLEGKRTADAERLTESGVAALEEALLRFLIEEKSQQVLLRMCDRLDDYVRDLPKPSPELRDRVKELRGRVAGAPHDHGGHTAVGGLAPRRSEDAGACEVCRAIEQATFDILSQHQYVLTVSEEEQQNLARAGGLCPLHTWTYHSLASPLGISVGYPPLLETWRDRLLALAARNADDRGAEAIDDARPTRESCIVCRACETAERDALCDLAQRLEKWPPALETTSAVCLGHLARLLPLIGSASLRESLLVRQAGLLERFAEDMRRYALKREGLRRALASAAEDEAALRALTMLAGRQNVSFVRRRS